MARNPQTPAYRGVEGNVSAWEGIKGFLPLKDWEGGKGRGEGEEERRGGEGQR